MKKGTIKSIQDSFLDPATNQKVRRELYFYMRKFILAPPYWNGLPNTPYHTFTWKSIEFKRANKSKLKVVEGLYFFILTPKVINTPFINYLLYIGETDNLQRRFGEYLDKIGDPFSSQYQMFTLIDDYPKNLVFYYVEIPGIDTATRKIREAELLTAFMPPINKKYPQLVERLVLETYNR